MYSLISVFAFYTWLKDIFHAMPPMLFTERIMLSLTSVKNKFKLFLEWIKAVDMFADRISVLRGRIFSELVLIVNNYAMIC